MCLCAFGLVLLFTSIEGPDLRDEVIAEIEGVKETYDKEFASAAVPIIKKFEGDIKVAQERGLASTVSELEAKKAEFKETLTAPEGYPTGPFYVRLRRARTKMVKDYRAVIAKAYAAKDTELAQELETMFVEYRASLNLDWLRPGESLQRGESLISRDGNYELEMTADGKLVLCRIESPLRRIVWTADTKEKKAIRFHLGVDGKCGLFDRNNNMIYGSLNEWQSPGKLVLQGDGNLVVFDGVGNVVWASETDE